MKNVHDVYNGYYPTTEQKSTKESKSKGQHLSEIKVEPLKTADHHQKNLYEKRYKNPSEFK